MNRTRTGIQSDPLDHVPCFVLRLVASALLAAAALLISTPLLANEPPQASTAPAVHKPLHPRSHPHAVHPAKVVIAPAIAAIPLAPPEPAMPHWPLNDSPSPAAVTWDSHGLRIEADNSSLAQILRDISTATGATVEGFGSDQRVFGSYGPGQAREILSQLLQGSGYNVLMVGDQGEGTPRQILLSLSNGATHGVQAPAPGGAAGEDEDADTEEPAPQPEAQRPPGLPARSAQQMMQDVQQRQMQMQRGGQPPTQPTNPPN